jgi:hypothetical protein
MSNQTFIKKDRISFAQNLNEKLVIAPSNLATNALFFGPNSAITYDGNSNITNIQYLQGVTLSNQYIYADGTYLSNLPNGIQQSNIDSTIRGLATFGYVSSTQLQSTVQGLGNIYISSAGGGVNQSQLVSTVIGLGNIYISTAGGGVGQLELTSSIIGLGTVGYVSSLIRISTNNISAGSLFAGIISSLQFSASSVNANRLTGPLGAIRTDNLYPFGTGSQLGFFGGAGTNSGGFYNQINARSTNTQVISPDVQGIYNNIVRIQGNTLVERLNASTIFTSSISTNLIIAQFLRGAGQFGDLVYTTTLLPFTNNVSGLGNGPVNSYSQIVGSNIRCFGIENQFGNSINSTVRILGTLSTLNTNASTIVVRTLTASTIFTSTLSTNLLLARTITGLLGLNITAPNGSINVSANIIPQLTNLTVGGSAEGFAFSQINSLSTLTSSITALGTNASTISIVGSLTPAYPTSIISSMNLGNITNRWFQTFAVSTITSTLNADNAFGTSLSYQNISTNFISSGEIYSAIGNFSNISGNGSSLFNLNAISSLSLQSTVAGLGTFGYVSTPSLFSSIQSYNFVSTSSLQSTVAGLGTVGYLSSFNSISSLNISTGFLYGDRIDSKIISTTYTNTYELTTKILTTNDLTTSTLAFKSFFDNLSPVITVYSSTINTIGVVDEATLYFTNSLNLNKLSIFGLNNLYFVDSNESNYNFFIGTSNTLAYFRLDNQLYNPSPAIRAVAQDWSLFAAEQNVNMNSNAIVDLKQTDNTYNAATNLIARRVSIQEPIDATINKTTFINVLDKDIEITYNNLYTSYTSLNCTFSFRCDGEPDNISYYFTLSNIGVDERSGLIFNATHPYIKNFVSKKYSITVQEQFDVTGWSNSIKFRPLMYVRTDNTDQTISSMKLSMVYEPILT